LNVHHKINILQNTHAQIQKYLYQMIQGKLFEHTNKLIISHCIQNKNVLNHIYNYFRASFPSGHACLAFYSTVYTIVSVLKGI
jgi:membrane-associated phospholipid phosphatase